MHEIVKLYTLQIISKQHIVVFFNYLIVLKYYITAKVNQYILCLNTAFYNY